MALDEIELNPWHPPCPARCGHFGGGWPLLPAKYGFWFDNQLELVDYWCENCNTFWTVKEILDNTS